MVRSGTRNFLSVIAAKSNEINLEKHVFLYLEATIESSRTHQDFRDFIITEKIKMRKMRKNIKIYQ